MAASTAEHATDSGKSEGGVENHSALRQPHSSAEAAADLSESFLSTLPLQNPEFQTAKLLGNGTLVQAANRPIGLLRYKEHKRFTVTVSSKALLEDCSAIAMVDRPFSERNRRAVGVLVAVPAAERVPNAEL